MEFSTRIALQASSRLALRPRFCPGCSSYTLLPSTSPSRQARQLTTTSRRNAVGQARPGGGQALGRQVMSQMGEANMNKLKGMSKARQPNDLGLFPGTFVQSPWHKYLPMLTTEPKLWLRIQGLILKKPFVNNFSLIYNLLWTRRKRFRITSHAPFNKEPIPTHLTTRIRDALTLHKQLNTAIATGDRKWLRDNCCSGLAEKACNRIDRRPHPKAGSPPVTEQWELVSYEGLLPGSWVPRWPLCGLLPGTSYKVMSDMVGQLPVAPDTLLRQAIVRIKSKQRYNLNDGKGEQTKSVTEYIVLQKMISQGDDADWRVWGTVNPTTIKDTKAIIYEDKPEGSFMDRVKSLMPTNMGSGPMM